MQLETYLTIIMLAPLAGAGLIWAFGRKNGNLAVTISMLAAGLILISSFAVLFMAWDGQAASGKVEWFEMGGFTIDIGYYLNLTSAVMLFVVSFVGFLIHLFSIGYMSSEAEKGRFFGGLSIFMFSMLGIVLAENLLMIFIFWELVGFSSYMLIGHYLKKEEAANASKKAFIVNRVGDFGFLIGIILCYWQFGTTSFIELEAAALANTATLQTLTGLLLFCGVLGKSAQMPLHVWLPDAMAGPTPISALIHAATMVAAGVFFLGRTWYLYTSDALHIIMWVGVITAACAAIWAFGQRDIKKILAYSTLSQLGYMVAAFSLGTFYGMHHGESAYAMLYGVGASMFHLTTHAFFKALLFLGSGSVIHACHHEQDIFKMGGLLKKMPITGFTFLIGVIAIAGVPFIGAGFFSKDIILYVAKSESTAAFVILTVTAVLTAIYMGRLFFIAFLGDPKSENAEHAKESNWTMTLPLVLLAIFSVFGGYAFIYPAHLQGLIHDIAPHPHGVDKTLMIVISLIASLGGLVFARFFYGAGAREDALEKSIKGAYALSKSRFYFDEIYGFYVEKIQNRIAEVIGFLDTVLIGGLFVRGSAGTVGIAGIIARTLHTGNLATYVWWFFIGVLIFGAYATGYLGRIF